MAEAAPPLPQRPQPPYLAPLNPAQRAAVEATEGPVLVLAGAGTGKTRVLTTRLAHILVTGRARPGELLAVTFTNKAAREMKDRISAILNRPVEGWWLGTFHALAARMLRQHAERVGLKPSFTILDTDDQLRLLKQLLQAEGIDDKAWPARLLLSVIERWKDRGLTPARVTVAEAGDLAGGRLLELYAAYQQRLLALNACDFGDLLLHCLELFRENPEVLAQFQQRFRYLLVDEYQDTNVAQYLWLRLLAQKHRNLCCVGDDDQCLVEGTLVTMADGRQVPIENVKQGDMVRSCYGSGEFRPARVSRVHRGAARQGLIKVSTAKGRTISATADHIHFADVLVGESRQRHYVYLMQKLGVGFRLGVSQIYTAGQRRPMLGFKQRCLQEHADALWLLASFESEPEAREIEHRLSLRYGITTLPFVARKGKSTGGLVQDQERLNRLHSDLAQSHRAADLLSEYGLDADRPHHQPQAVAGRRRNLTVTYYADRRGTTPMHRVSLSGNDPADRDAVRALGLSARVYKRNAANWRYESSFRDMQRVEEVRDTLAQRFNLAIVRKANLLGRGMTLHPARSLRPGMVMVGEDGAYDEIVAVDRVPAMTSVYDLDVHGTHNYVANGLVTHNSIYAWRGAEVGNILRFEEDFPGAKVIRLEQNYRSTGRILAAASGLIAKNEQRLGKTLWTEGEEGEPVRIRGLWDGEAEARFVAEEIEALQSKGHALRGMAILTRIGAQSREFEERFITVGLPYRVVGGLRFYERAEIRDALAYLRLVHAPDDDLAFERIVNKPKRGLGDQSVAQLYRLARQRQVSLFQAARLVVETDELRPQARRALADFVAAVGRWRAYGEAEGHVRLAELVLDESGYTAMLQLDRSAEAPGRLENLKELIEALAEFDTLGGFLEHVSLVMERAEEAGADMVTLMTLHAAKGLEFDTVFLPGWEDGLFPNQRAMDESGLKGLEEERRLAYVGLTRARERAILSFAANRRLHGNWSATLPSRFLDELPAETVERESDPGLYGGAGGLAWAAGGQLSGLSPGYGGWGEGRASPGFERARARGLQGSRFLDLTPVRVTELGGHDVGARVFHQKFGYGSVTAVEGDRLTIAFDKAGEKKVVAAFVVPADKAG